MAIKTKRIKINSIKITRELLEELGDIIERETQERNHIYNKLIDKKTEEIKKNIKYPENYNAGKKEQLLEERIKDVKHINRPPHYSIVYTINSDNEDLEFSSMDELLSIKILPRKILSMSFRISNYDENHVDTHIIFDNDRWPIKKLDLASKNEEKILKTEDDLKKIFFKHRTDYNWIFKFFLGEYLLTLVPSCLFVIIFIKYTFFFFPKSATEIILLVVWVLFGFNFYLFNSIRKYLYPFCLFNLDDKIDPRKKNKRSNFSCFNYSYY